MNESTVFMSVNDAYNKHCNRSVYCALCLASLIMISYPASEISENRRFARGTLELQAQDGSRIVLTADNEDAETFEVIVSRDNVDTVVLSEPWADWIERLSFD